MADFMVFLSRAHDEEEDGHEALVDPLLEGQMQAQGCGALGTAGAGARGGAPVGPAGTERRREGCGGDCVPDQPWRAAKAAGSCFRPAASR